MHKTFRIVPGACLVNVLSSLKAHGSFLCFFNLLLQHSSLLLRSGLSLWFWSWEGSSLGCSARLVLVGPSLLVERWAQACRLGAACSQAVACDLSGFGTWLVAQRHVDLPGPGIGTCVPCICEWNLVHCTTREVPFTWSWRRYGRAYPPVKEKVELSLFGTLWEVFSPETGL